MIPFPEKLYGVELSRSLYPAEGYCGNILEIVSEMLLNAAIVGKLGEHFIRCFQSRKSDTTRERVWESLCSSEWFRETERKMRSISGINENAYLLGLLLSYDAAAVNLKTGNSATPLYVSVGNVSYNEVARNSENINFVGFFPKHTVPFIKDTYFCFKKLILPFCSTQKHNCSQRCQMVVRTRQ